MRRNEEHRHAYMHSPSASASAYTPLHRGRKVAKRGAPVLLRSERCWQEGISDEHRSENHATVVEKGTAVTRKRAPVPGTAERWCLENKNMSRYSILEKKEAP